VVNVNVPFSRTRPAAPPPDERPAPVPAAAAVELGDDDLELVVGGLQRIWAPGETVVAGF
jgi:hypothetical protein